MDRRMWLKRSGLGVAALGLGSSARAAMPMEGGLPKLGSSYPYINLGTNENQFGPSPKALAAMQAALYAPHEYNVALQGELTRVLAAKEGVAENQILLGAGSADLLMAAGLAFGKPGTSIVSSDPTFAPLMGTAERLGTTLIKIPWDSGCRVQLKLLRMAVTPQTALVYICNPENPSATLLEPEELKAFIREVAETCPVFVDEAYLDLAGDLGALSMAQLVREDLPVIVSRTFSKVYGLAGMRVGYAVTTPELAKRLQPNYVNGIGLGCSRPSLAGALAAVQDTAYMEFVKAETLKSRAYIEGLLADLGSPALPSAAPFVFVPVTGDPEAIVAEVQAAVNVQIRPRSFFGKNYLRISIGRMDQMELLGQGLRAVMG